MLKAEKKVYDKPMIYLHPEAWEHLKNYYDGAAAALEQYFVPTSEESKPSSEAIALADSVAGALEGVCYSTDTDCSYFACVLSGVDMENDSAFYGGVGIEQDLEVQIGGFDSLKLETMYGRTGGEEFTPTFDLLTGLGEDALEEIDEYVDEESQESYREAAALLDEKETVVGGYLCADDEVSRIRFTFGKTSSDAWAGVITVGIET